MVGAARKKAHLLFLPIGDTPNPHRYTPFVTWGLIGINGLIYLAITLPLSLQAPDPNDPLVQEYLRHVLPTLPFGMPAHRVLAQIDAYSVFAFVHGYKPAAPEYTDLFASLFLHGSFAHLAGNMLFLWIYGDNVEHRLGRLGFLLTYLGAGVIATWSFSAFAQDSMLPLIGASGAISGVLGLYFVLFPRNRVKVFIFLFPFFMHTVFLPARLVLGFYVVVDNLLPVISGLQSNVAYGAHLGGFLFGVLIAKLGERFAWRWPGADGYWRTKTKGHEEPRATLEAFKSALERNDREEIVTLFRKLGKSASDTLHPKACITLAQHLLDSGHDVAASEVLRRALGQYGSTDHPNLADIYLAMGLLRLKRGQTTAAYHHLLAAMEQNPSRETAIQARAALDSILRYRPN